MPTNPYDDEALKRRAQVDQLRGASPEPVSHAMSSVAPIGGRAPSGWEQGNWDDPNMHSVKYDAGRLLSGLTRPSEVGQRVQSPEFQGRFPGATFNGKDWIDFQGILSDGDRGEPVHGIDYLRGANPETDTSEGAWWGAPDTASASPVAAAPRRSMVNPAADNSSLMRIMAELDAASNGTPSPTEREALLAMLQGGR